MKQFFICPHCEKKIDPIVVTPNSIKVLKFLNKMKVSVRKYEISSATMEKYGRSCQIVLENLDRDGLIDIDFTEKRGVYKSVYYKINKLGKLVLKRMLK